MNSEDRSVFDLPSRRCDSVEKYGLDPAQIIEVFDPASRAFGQVVLIHGGYWRPEFDCAHLRSYAGALADLGWRVQLIEYRRVPGFPNKSVEDIRAAIVHCGGGVLIGHSAGGHLALLATNEITNSIIKGVIALAPVGDLASGELLGLDDGAIGLFLGDFAANRPDLDPNLTLNTTSPIVIIHGTNDDRVPVELSRNLNQTYNLAGLNCRLIEIEDIGHFELIDYRKPPLEIVIEELKKLYFLPA